MQEHVHTDPLAGDSVVLRIEYDNHIGVWRVYVQGDAAIKPLHTSTSAAAARKVFEETRTAMMARAGA